MDRPVSLYFNEEPISVEILDLCRGADDYRKIYIADNATRKIVIKNFSNTFSNRHRIEGWFKLMDEYRKAGLYVPAIVPDLNGELLLCDKVNGREFYTYAEEYSAHEIMENIDKKEKLSSDVRSRIWRDVMRFLGKIASARLDILDWQSAYCLLEPFCAPDTTDEATEYAGLFVNYVKENLPHHLPRAEALLKMFRERQEELKKVYYSLPTSCFQADLNDSNILLDENNEFVGLIDFNLCGKEPVLNYAVREALWAVDDKRLFGENDSRLYCYNKDLDDLRIELFLKNMSHIGETYNFSSLEREVFPVLFRYINSFWWFCIDEIKMNREDDNKIGLLFDWLEFSMTRDDIRLP